MSDTGFMTIEEFARLYGRDLASKELVVLTERDGEHMWQRNRDGWYRLGGEEAL